MDGDVNYTAMLWKQTYCILKYIQEATMFNNVGLVVELIIITAGDRGFCWR
jgi:hypothetical protein